MDLRDLAGRYIWWMTPEQALRDEDFVIAQVMNLGTFEDLMALRKFFHDDALRAVLARAKAGWFSPKRWNFWHVVLNGCDPETVPPLPERPLPPRTSHV